MTTASANPRRNFRAGALAVVATAALLPAALRAAEPTPRAPAVQTVIDCRKITDDTQRLACFDHAVDAMAEAETKGDLLTIDREQRRAVRRQAFGLSLPSFTLFDRGEKPGESDKISVKIAAAARNPYGKWIFTLDDGAVWRQIDDNDLPNGAHAGSTAVIRKASLGSFFINVDGQEALRAHRDR